MEYRSMELSGRHEAERLLLRFYEAMDTGPAERIAGFFAPDAIWIRRGVRLAGREAIHDAMAARPATARTAHLVSNFRLEESGANGCNASYYLTAYLMAAEPDGATPPQLPFQLAWMSVAMAVCEGSLLVSSMGVREQKFIR